MFENVKTVWDIVIPVGAGITIGAIVVFIGLIIIKAVIGKLVGNLIGGIDYKKIAENATQKGIDTLKTVHFTQNVEPLAKSELLKVSEQANAMWEKRALFFEEKWDKAIKVLEIFTEYFDNSIGVPAEKKAELKSAFAEIKKKDLPPVETEIELVPETTAIEPPAFDNETKESVMVDR